jgi:DNA helicase-2/ATP-dependent DNA helicase PcrA
VNPPEPPEHLADLVDGLNADQAAAVLALEGPLVVIAGPGSGKTRVLTHRVAALIADGVTPWRICAVTFTNKAAAEMRERVRRLVGDEVAGEVAISTFHSLCARILRRDGADVGLRSGFGIADADDSRKILRRILVGMGMEGREATRAANDAANRISLAKSRLEGPERMASSTDPQDRAVAEVAARYAAELAEQNLVDFDDLLVLTVALLEGASDAAQRWRRRFTHLLVDEFQDTNGAQYRILRLLADAGENQNVCVVGDPKQAIYGWRGATAASVDVFRADHPQRLEVTLRTNYRSTPQICSVCSTIIAPVSGADGKLVPAGDDIDGAPVRLAMDTDTSAEAARVASEIERAGHPWSQRAVLYRTNAQSLQIEQELRRRGVPYEIIGGQRFYERAEVRDAFSWLRLVANPTELGALERALATPRRGIGDKARESLVLAARSAGASPVDVLADPPAGLFTAKAAAGAAAFSTALAAVAAAAAEGPGPAVRAVLEMPGFRKAACEGPGRAQLAAERSENLDELLSDALRFTEDHPELDGMTATLEYLEAVSLRDEAEDAELERVGLMTVHAAKGREFDDVWVIGVEDGLFPHVISEGDGDAVDEERRLLFVAASRAAKRLCLSHAMRRQVAGSWEDRLPSPFLVDLTDEQVTRVGSALSYVPRSRSRRPDHRRGPASRGSSPTPTAPSAARRPAPSAPGPRVDPGRISKGCFVEHEVFGRGEVLGVTGDVVDVRFADKRRALMASAAPMRVV